MNQMIEPLEGRRLMSTTPTLDVTLNGDVLTINNANYVTVTASFNQQPQVVVTSQGHQPEVFAGDDPINHGTFLGVHSIVITGTNADDSVFLNVSTTGIHTDINTGTGKDIIMVSGSFDTVAATDPDFAMVTIDGGNGVDQITVSDTTYYIWPSNGKDLISTGF